MESDQISSRLRIITRINQCNKRGQGRHIFSSTTVLRVALSLRVEEPTIFTKTVDYVNGNQGTIEAQLKDFAY
jgi:hypothetical protein